MGQEIRDRQTLREAASVLREALRGFRSQPDAVAYASLGGGDVAEPYSSEAESRWGMSSRDVWHEHHRAVLHHSHAYDLEAHGIDASSNWNAALAAWANVIEDDLFWLNLGQSAGKALGAPVDPAIPENVREDAPEQLLSVHITLARRTYTSSPPLQSAAHIRCLRRAPFADALKARVLKDFGAPFIAKMLDLRDQNKWKEALSVSQHHLQVDPDSIDVLILDLQIRSEWNKRLLNLKSIEQIQVVQDEGGTAAKRIEQLGTSAISGWREVLARHFYWWLVLRMKQAEMAWEEQQNTKNLRVAEQKAVTIRKLADQASAPAKKARATDPLLSADGYYKDMDELEAYLYWLAGMTFQQSAIDGSSAAAHEARLWFQKATELDPRNAAFSASLVLALYLEGTDEGREQAKRTLEHAEGLAAGSDTAAHKKVRDIRRVIAVKEVERAVSLAGAGNIFSAVKVLEDVDASVLSQDDTALVSLLKMRLQQRLP